MIHCSSSGLTLAANGLSVNTKKYSAANCLIINKMNTAAKQYPSRSAPRISVRLSEDLKKKLVASSERNNRNINQEVVAILKDYLGGSHVDPKMVGEEVSKYITGEARLMMAFRRLSDNKKRALLTLLEDT